MIAGDVTQKSAGRSRLTALLPVAAIAAIVVSSVLMFQWPPATRLALRIEPFVAVFLGGIAVLLSLRLMVNWLRRPTQKVRGDAAQERRTPRMGLVVCVAAMVLFLLPVVSVWNSHYPSADAAASALLSRLPWSDATGYWEGALGVLEHGKFDTWNYRRPLNAILYSVRLGLSGLNFELSLLMQAIALGLSVFFAAKAIRISYGTVSAVVFVAAIYPFARNYVALTLSEALGITLGCLALAGFIAGTAEDDDRVTLASLFVLGLALFARTGTMLVLPALILWFSLTGHRSWRQIFRRFILSSFAAILLPMLLNKGLTLLYGQGQGMMNDNFANTILGLTMGTNWIGAQTHYWSELQKLPTDQQAMFMYYKAWEHLQDNPMVFLRSLQHGLGHFLDGFPLAYRSLSVPASLAYVFEVFGPVTFASLAVLAAAQLVIRTSWSIVGFWLAVLTGFMLSVPFIWDDGGPRVLAATIPLLAGLVATTFATRGPDAHSARDNREISVALIRLTAALVLTALVMPGLLHLLYASPAPAANTLQADDVLIDGYATVGAEVVDRPNRNRRRLTQIDLEQLAYSVRTAVGGQDVQSFLDYPRPYYFFLAYDLHQRYPIFVFAPASKIPPKARVVKIKVKKSHRIPYIGYLVE